MIVELMGRLMVSVESVYYHCYFKSIEYFFPSMIQCGIFFPFFSFQLFSQFVSFILWERKVV